MADDAGADRTEEPTPKRLTEARRRGEVALSRDLSGALGTLAVLLVLAVLAGAWLSELLVLMREVFTSGARGSEDFPLLGAQVGWRAMVAAVRVLAPPLLAALVVAIAAGALQTGGLLSFSVVKPDLARVVPDAKRVFGTAKLFELAKGAVIVGLITAVAFLVTQPLLAAVPGLTGAAAAHVMTALGQFARPLLGGMLFASLLVGAGDFLWQRRQHHKRLRMTREEVKREHKESEGDPHHKAERQRVHRALSQERMLAEVKKADFVVVNPEHIAVAIRYDEDEAQAPVVVASGENLIAQRIKELAREAGVPIFRDVTLARSLREVTEGDEIPHALYEAVAEILRVVQGLGPGPGAASAAGTKGTPPSAASRPAGAGWRRV